MNAKPKLYLLKKFCLFFVYVLVLDSCSTQLSPEHQLPQVGFALEQIKKAQSADGPSSTANFTFSLDPENLPPEGYNIEVKGDETFIRGGDARGLLYGGLEAAEQIELAGKVIPSEGRPFLEKRGIKFNIPLDARTPSYDDTGDAAQKNILEMWSWEFWEEFLDDMAIHRYNTLTLWNPHPFPSMIKLTEYPEVALDDVCVTTLQPIGIENEWGDPQLVTENVMANLKVVKKITIDEKIAFWKKVMRHAKDRGIDIYFITWNICPNSVATPVKPFYKTFGVELENEQPGKHGITHQMDNPITTAYYRNAVKTFLLTYPDVKGIGVTAGEHMPANWDEYNREKWLWESYGSGILDAKAEQPNREIDFIHRVWFSDMDEIMKYWGKYPDRFEVSFKYAKARLYSSPNLVFAKDHIESMKKYGLKSWWNLRNDDIFVYRWGDPDFVRAFLRYFSKEHTAGYYMGSDGYVWGREFISKDPALSGELEIKKHWYNFMLWGRLGYNDKLDKSFFIRKLAKHFPQVEAGLLYETWQEASKIIPLVNVFHWRDWDHMFAVEACLTKPKWGGFRDITHFMDNPTMKGSNMLNPRAFVQATLAGKDIQQKTPLHVVDSLYHYADIALTYAQKLRKEDNPAELKTLIDDIEAMGHLGNYYASKIRAAVDLVFYQEKENKAYQLKAVSHLEAALQHWKKYTAISETNYKSQMLARTFLLSWSAVMERVKEDIKMAKGINTLIIR